MRAGAPFEQCTRGVNENPPRQIEGVKSDFTNSEVQRSRQNEKTIGIELIR